MLDHIVAPSIQKLANKSFSLYPNNLNLSYRIVPMSFQDQYDYDVRSSSYGKK